MNNTLKKIDRLSYDELREEYLIQETLLEAELMVNRALIKTVMKYQLEEIFEQMLEQDIIKQI